jgi:thiol-disulfide isomerase/thioredoxin
MKKTPIVISVVVVIVLGVGYLLLNSRQTDTPVSTQVTSTTQEQLQDSDADSQVSGKYINYSPEALDQSTGTRVLYFHASWCPQCRDLDADIRKNGVPSGVTILKVDYDSNQELRKKYGVTLQTTLVKLDESGNGVAKFVAYEDPSLQAVKNNLL